MKSLNKIFCGLFLGAIFVSQLFSKQLLLLDVSMKNVFADCHIEGAINVPFNKVVRFSRKIDKESEIVFYCTNYRCVSSTEACKIFQQKGFKDISVYKGGVAEWYQLNKKDGQHPVVGPCKFSFLSQENEKIGVDGESVKVINVDQLKIMLDRAKLDGELADKIIGDSLWTKISNKLKKISANSVKTFFSDIFSLDYWKKQWLA